jgi:hypothetical protein
MPYRVLTLARPSWHSVIFYVGVANVARTLLGHGYAEPEPHAHLSAYVLCAGVALLIARLVGQARSALTSRVCSGCLGMAALLFATLHSHVHALAPVPALAVLLAGICVGEVSHRLRGTRRPSWHSMVFLVGAAGVTRTVLVAYHADRPAFVHYGAYGLCLALALLAATIMRRVESPLTPRVHSGSLGLTGLLLALAHADTPAHAPVAITALVLAATCAGELVYRRRALTHPAKTLHRDPTP